MLHILTLSSAESWIEAYGLWVVFAVVILESIGIPMPGETALVAAAIYAGSTHHLDILSVIVTATIAATIGGTIGYLFGRAINFRWLVRYGRYVHLDYARLKVGQYLFMRHGGKIVFFGRFVALLRTFAAVLAGINRMPCQHFLVMNTLGATGWAVLFGGGAYLFGEQIGRVAGPIGLLLLLVVVGLCIAGIIFFRHHEKELEERAITSLPDDFGA